MHVFKSCTSIIHFLRLRSSQSGLRTSIRGQQDFANDLPTKQGLKRLWSLFQGKPAAKSAEYVHLNW